MKQTAIVYRSETKVCSGCRERKMLSEFHKHKQGAKGVASKCKPCIQDYYNQKKRIPRESEERQTVNQIINWRL